MVARAGSEWCKFLRIKWNADRVCGIRLELQHFLIQHGVDICLLSEIFISPGQALQLDNYANARQIDSRDGRTTIIHRGIVQQTVPVPGLTQLEFTDNQLTVRKTADSFTA